MFNTILLFRNLVTVAILMLCSLLLLQMLQSILIFDQQLIATGEWWRVWTGHFVHTNIEHLLLNATGFALLLLLYQPQIILSTLFSYSVYLATCIGLGIFCFNPEIERYAGFSGVLYGLFTFSALQAIFKRDFLLGYGVFFVLSGKIIWENIDPSINNHNALLINADIASEAHLYGYLAAILYGVWTQLRFFIYLKIGAVSGRTPRHK